MKIVYTFHAKEKMVERNISKKIVKNALKNPDTIIETRCGRLIAHKQIKGKLLRIVYNEENKVYLIITAYFTEPKRYGEKNENNI
ncbi:MAG: DUF4258 domain-containing protein [Candidatus Diapherotrites archaeon]|nr:DUF4258 domain-containing protein [Candidatus Diapherotrites archaeon]